MNKPMSTRQVRNAVKTLNLVLETGKDIKINGDFRGSYGFITNASKLRISKIAVCDYTGGRNEFAEPEKFLDTVNWYFKNNYTPDRVQRI